MAQRETLADYLPAGTYTYIEELWDMYEFHLKVSKPRRTKLGDYRPPQNGKSHRISVNGDLNNYAFLITLIHEIAHLKTYNEHKWKVKPHGLEWKTNFKQLMYQPLSIDIFPEDVSKELNRYMRNPKASSCVDVKLYKALRNYNSESSLIDSNLVLIESLNEGDCFIMPNGKKYQLGKKARSRYKCTSLANGKTYTVSGIAEVYLSVE